MWLSWFYNILTIPLYHYMTSCPPVILILVINGSDNDLSSFSQQLLPEAKWTCHQNIFIFSIRWCIQNDIHQCSLKKLQSLHLSLHYNDVTMSVVASEITSLMIVYSTIYSSADQRKHQSSASLAFVLGIHWWLVNSLQKRARNTENVSIWLCHHGVQINGVSWTIG